MKNNLKVATYNIRTDTTEDGQWAWAFRKNKVLDLITYHDWDVFGLQETMPTQVKDLGSINGYQRYHEEREGDGTGEGLGIYYKVELFKEIDKGYFWLSKTPNKPSIHPEAGCKRIAIWMVLQDKRSLKEFLLINTHLDHVSEAARLEGMIILLETLQGKMNDYPTILLGDFNAEPEEILHIELKKKFSYPREQESVFCYGPEGTCQDFNYLLPWHQLEKIDYILYKDLECLKHGVLTDSCDGKYPSDHFPVEALVVL